MNIRVLIASIVSLLTMVTMCDGCKSYPDFDYAERGEFRSMEGKEISNNLIIQYRFPIEGPDLKFTDYYSEPGFYISFTDITDDSAVLSLRGGITNISSIAAAESTIKIDLPDRVIAELDQDFTIPVKVRYYNFKKGNKKCEQVDWYGEVPLDEYSLIVNGHLTYANEYDLTITVEPTPEIE